MKNITDSKITTNNNTELTVIVDPGKNSVKVTVYDNEYNLQKKFSFPSKTMRKRNFADIDTSNENQYKVILNNEKYLVGDGVVNNYNFDITKNNFHHKLCIYTAIANSINKNGTQVRLVVGYPSSDYRNEEQLKEYRNLLTPKNGFVSMILNEEVKSFEIKEINVLPEGIALKPRMANPKKATQIIDLGGQNLNYRNYDVNGNTLKAFSLDHAGINHLEEYLKKELRTFIRADIIDVDAIDFLEVIKNTDIDGVKDEYVTNYNSTKEFANETILTFIENNIIGPLNTKGINLYQKGHFIIFTGGGSLLLEPYLRELLPNNEGNMYFSPTCRWDNCISYAIKDLGDRYKNNSLLNTKSIKELILKYGTKILDFRDK